MKGIKMAEKRFKCLVSKCGRVVRRENSMRTHVKNVHHKKSVLGLNFAPTNDPLTNPKRNGPRKVKMRKPAAKKRVVAAVITDKTRFIDVPCTIRIRLGTLWVEGVNLRTV